MARRAALDETINGSLTWLAADIRIRGIEHPKVAWTQMLLAQVLQAKGRPTRPKRFFARRWIFRAGESRRVPRVVGKGRWLALET